MADFNERIREMGQQTFANATQTTQNAAGMFNRAMQDFYSIGLSWMRYGVEVGRQALQAGIRSLETTASMIGEVTDRLSKEAQQRMEHQQPSAQPS